MERQAHDGISDERMKEVRNEIGRWRRTREKRTRMPAELWAAAVALARTHGTYRMARALGVDYQSLGRRAAESGGKRATGRKLDGFVELRGADLLGAATVVEVSDADGGRLTIRIGAGSALDVTALVSAFRRRAT